MRLDYSQEMNEVWTSYKDLRIQSNDFSGQLNTEQVRARVSLRLNEVRDFVTAINYRSIAANLDISRDKLQDLKEAIDKTTEEINNKKVQIHEKKQQLNDEGKGAERVNHDLTDFFGHEFLSLRAIESEKEKQIRFEIVSNGKRAYHLSEGECSLIAFCYFMARLDDVETSNTQPIIWIDDPISSLDGNHIFFVYSKGCGYLKNELERLLLDFGATLSRYLGGCNSFTNQIGR